MSSGYIFVRPNPVCDHCQELLMKVKLMWTQSDCRTLHIIETVVYKGRSQDFLKEGQIIKKIDLHLLRAAFVCRKPHPLINNGKCGL